MVRNQLPAQVVEIDEKQGTIFLETLDTNVIIFVSIPNIRWYNVSVVIIRRS